MTYQASPGLSVGHVHLKVTDLERSVAFYREVIGLDLVQRYGRQAAFLSAGGYHHHLGLNTWESLGAPPAPRRAPGLYHVAFLFPDRPSLGRAVGNVVAKGVSITGAADHGVSLAVYLDDPDGNGIELYWDRARDEWPRDAAGEIEMFNAPFDVPALIAEGEAAEV